MSDGDKYYEKPEVGQRENKQAAVQGSFQQKPGGREGASHGDARGDNSPEREGGGRNVVKRGRSCMAEAEGEKDRVVGGEARRVQRAAAGEMVFAPLAVQQITPKLGGLTQYLLLCE